jgi:methionyl-tRNA formyltransferase
MKIHKPFRIIFMGTPLFAVPSLKVLLDQGEDVVAVVTQPDRPKGRGRKMTASPVKQLAADSGLLVLQPEKIRGEDFLEQLASYHPDLIIVTAYGRILPGHLLRMPTLGTINVHGSLLPKYRGAAPVQWALIKGERETGVTIMQMDEGMDTGDMLYTKTIPIAPEDTAGSLMVKLAELGGQALAEALDRLHLNRLPSIRQDEAQATLAPPLNKEMACIDWTRPAEVIDCLIRGLDPWPMAYTTIAGERLRLFKPRVIPDMPAEQSGETAEAPAAGILCRADGDGLTISTGRGFLLIKEVQADGGRRMPASAYLSGRSLPVGLRFGATAG